jgi:hypothetical protein
VKASVAITCQITTTAIALLEKAPGAIPGDFQEFGYLNFLAHDGADFSAEKKSLATCTSTVHPTSCPGVPHVVA